MKQRKISESRSRVGRGCWILFIIIVLLLSFPIYIGVSLAYTETKGPFKNWNQVVD